jgi:predicted nucleic acid-binding protein
MMYLLDVNALVAFGFQQHEFHRRVVLWVQREQPARLATCSITELGFVRILTQTAGYGLAVGQARTLLLHLKESSPLQFTFINDSHDVSQLPFWVKTAGQITDGHLAQLAKSNGGLLATLDRKIPGAFLIPES